MNTPTKICSICKKELPATPEFFHYRNKSQGTFKWACKTCRTIEKRQYRKAHIQHIKQQSKEYRDRTKDKQIARHKEYDRTHPEIVQKRQRKYCENHKEKRRLNTKNWRIRNPEKRRAMDHRRRNVKLDAIGRHTAEDIAKQYKVQKGKCYWCGQKVKDDYHVDHVIPLDRGGSDGPENIVIACPHCNLSKYNKLPHEWHGNGGKLL